MRCTKDWLVSLRSGEGRGARGDKSTNPQMKALVGIKVLDAPASAIPANTLLSSMRYKNRNWL